MKCDSQIVADNARIVRSWDDDTLLKVRKLHESDEKRGTLMYAHNATGRAYHRFVRREVRRRGLV